MLLVAGAFFSESLIGQEAVPGTEFRPPSEFSFSDGVDSLVEAKQSWRASKKCISCHTTGWGLAAQPTIALESKEVSEGRAFAQTYLVDYVDGIRTPHKQYGSTEGLVATAAFLAMSDARVGGKVHSATRKGLDHAWQLLDESGTWEEWLQCNWPPFESDAEFGPTLMLVALGELQQIESLQSQDKGGAKKLTHYLKKNPPMSLHAKAMRLWADHHWPKVVGKQDQRRWLKELLNSQSEDGGWSMASLAGPAWKRDGGEAQTTTSEAYPTAFATYVLLHMEHEQGNLAIHRGLDWLRAHQRLEGDWFTRSPRRDRKHYISRAATAFALMALKQHDLQECLLCEDRGESSDLAL